MLPAGYMYKRVAASPPDWGLARAIYSVSACISENFTVDYINFWKHNGYWLFDTPAIIEELAGQHAIDLSGTTRFYYEVYEREFDAATRQWVSFAPDAAFPTNVSVPQEIHLRGFDVVTFSVRTAPECSPLSCNLLAETMPVNQHCLFDTIDEAKGALESGLFDKGEPGPYRIFVVHALETAQCA